MPYSHIIYKFLNIFKKSILLILPLIIILSPNIAHVFIFEEGDVKKIIGRLLILVCIFLLPIPLFYQKIKWYYILLSPLLILTFCINYLHIFLKSSINTEVIFLVVGANKNESLEFLSNIPFIFILSIMISIICYYLIVKYMPKSIKFKNSLLILGFSLFIITVLPIIKFGTSNLKENIKESYIHFFPFKGYTQYKLATGIKSEILNFKDRTKNLKFNAHKTFKNKEREVHVLVIGETSRAQNWGLYGYNRNTNPLLNKQNIIVFRDVISSGYITSKAVPIMLTGVTPSDFNSHFNKKSFISAFKEVKFKTFYICTQSGGATDIDIHAKEADFYVMPSIKYEEELTNILDKVIINNKENLLIVFHTSGNHWRYDHRYPDQYDIYKPSLKGSLTIEFSKNNIKEIINSYDNSILFTDFVLSSLINKLDSLNLVSSLTYISDHGENILDDDRNYSLHAQATKYTSSVPMIMWFSKKYQLYNTRYVKTVIKNKDKKISTENVFYTLLDLAGVSFKNFNIKKSIGNDSFIEYERYLITEDGLTNVKDIK